MPLPKLRSIEATLDEHHFLELLRGVAGRVLCHEESRDERTRAVVTYASLAFPA